MFSVVIDDVSCTLCLVLLLMMSAGGQSEGGLCIVFSVVIDDVSCTLCLVLLLMMSAVHCV